jgi:hypothetical protein
MDPYNINQKDLQNIIISNKELKSFFNNIIDTITYFIDEEQSAGDYISLTIYFIYNNCSFELYTDDEIRKLSIINKNIYHYECFYENHEDILIKKCKLKNVSVDEMTDLLRQLSNIINKV